MGRIIAIDYGQKRVGIAVTDVLKIIATPLETVPTNQIWTFLQKYITSEPVERVVVGNPVTLKNEASDASAMVNGFVNKFRKTYPNIPLEMYDERFTSKMAARALVDGGMKKSDRRDKTNLDRVSAAILLQSYMEYLNNKA